MICLIWGLLILCSQTRVLCSHLCGESRLVIGAEGSDVTLRVGHSGVTGEITWLAAGKHFATTEAGGITRIRDKRYRGKVSSTEDGSLVITRLVSGDEGRYTASMLRHTTHGTQLCAQLYDLRMYRNDSSSTEKIEALQVSSTVGGDASSIEQIESLQLASTGRGEDIDHSLLNTIRLVAAAGLLIAACWIILQHVKMSHGNKTKQEPISTQHDQSPEPPSDAMDVTSVYVLIS